MGFDLFPSHSWQIRFLTLTRRNKLPFIIIFIFFYSNILNITYFDEFLKERAEGRAESVLKLICRLKSCNLKFESTTSIVTQHGVIFQSTLIGIVKIGSLNWGFSTSLLMEYQPPLGSSISVGSFVLIHVCY